MNKEFRILFDDNDIKKPLQWSNSEEKCTIKKTTYDNEMNIISTSAPIEIDAYDLQSIAKESNCTIEEVLAIRERAYWKQWHKDHKIDN